MSKQKYISLTFRLTDDDSDHVKRQAQAAGLTVSAYLRQLAMGQPIIPQQHMSDVRFLARQLAPIGNNLNQLARHANHRRGETDDNDLASEVALLRADVERLTNYASRL